MSLRRIVLGFVALILAMIGSLGAGATSQVPGSSEAVYWFPGTPLAGQRIGGASATLLVREDGASATFTSSGLEPGTTVTLWWVVFNNPELCTQGTAPYRCGVPDLIAMGGDEAIAGTMVYGGGDVIGSAGSVDFAAFLPADDASDVALGGPGLVNTEGAEIHLVLRDHGPLIERIASQQLGTFGGGCNNMPAGTGAPGPYACADVQFAVPVQ
jgi:hypothetical protein